MSVNTSIKFIKVQTIPESFVTKYPNENTILTNIIDSIVIAHSRRLSNKLYSDFESVNNLSDYLDKISEHFDKIDVSCEDINKQMIKEIEKTLSHVNLFIKAVLAEEFDLLKYRCGYWLLDFIPALFDFRTDNPDCIDMPFEWIDVIIRYVMYSKNAQILFNTIYELYSTNQLQYFSTSDVVTMNIVRI